MVLARVSFLLRVLVEVKIDRSCVVEDEVVHAVLARRDVDVGSVVRVYVHDVVDDLAFCIHKLALCIHSHRFLLRVGVESLYIDVLLTAELGLAVPWLYAHVIAVDDKSLDLVREHRKALILAARCVKG